MYYRNHYDQNNNNHIPVPPYPPAAEPPKKKNGGRLVSRVAGLLAVSLVSGAAGGGVSYALFQNGADGVIAETTATLPVQQELTASTDEEPVTDTKAVTGLAATNDIAAIAATASASVVEVSVELASYNPFFGQSVTSGSGSGVVYSQDGYIITNNHVVEGATAITIRTNEGEEYEAALVGTDSETDLAVLKVEAEGLTPATFANSDNIAVGELAVAIGNPLGTLGGTVTDGIISAVNREITIDGNTMSLLQTSAAVNPGNSGGGLFNSEAALIGIVNAKSAGSEVEGLGFAIPANTVREVVADLIESGYVTGRTELGITIMDITDPQTASMYRLDKLGVYVIAVSRDNGLRAGDRLIAINGQAVEASTDVTDLVRESQVGDEWTVVLERDGEQITVSVLIGEKVPDAVKDSLQSAML